MSKDNNLIFKNTGILFFRLILISGIGLFTSRFVIRSLGISDYGLYNVVGGIVVMMAFLNTVMVTTTYRFIAFEIGKGNSEGVNKVFNISLIIHLFLAFLVLFLTETIGVFYVKNYLTVDAGKLYDALFVLRFSTYATVVSIVSIPYMGLITAKEAFGVQAVVEVIRSILGLIVAITLIYFLGNRIRMYAVLIVVVNLIPPAILFVYCKNRYKEIVKWNFQKEKDQYKDMLGFSGWTLIGAAASVGKTTGTSLVINFFFGTILNAAFGIANQINSLILMFAMNLSQAAIPQITKSYSSGDTSRSIMLASYISKYTLFLMFIPAFPILLETEFILNLWLGEVPIYTAIFCQLLVVSTLISGLGNGLGAVIQATGQIKYFQIILSTTSLLSIPIAYFLFRFGMPPASIIVVIIATTSINVVFTQILLKYIMNFNVISFLKISFLKVFYVAILTFPLFFIKNLFTSGLTRFILFTGFSVLWLLIVIYFAGLESKEKEMLGEKTKIIFERIKSIQLR